MKTRSKNLTFSLLLALILSFCGGMLDAYSLTNRGFFALMQTGNLISVFINLVKGDWNSLLVSFVVVITFIIGLILSNFIEYIYEKKKKDYRPLELVISLILSKTILKGEQSSFILEMPPYRRPQLKSIIERSVRERILYVLGRAVVVAAPAGALIWLMQNITIGDISLIAHIAGFLDPFARLMGLDGYILTAFILGMPANEIVLPIVIMCYTGNSGLIEFENLSELGMLLREHGWTHITAICTMLFSLNHFPCTTTLLTIKKETKSVKWTIAAFIIPTVTGILICMAVNFLLSLLIV